MLLRRHALIFLSLLLAAGIAWPLRAHAAVSFQPAVTYATAGAFSVTTADLDGDGKLDIVAIGGQSLSILYGKGDGTFEPAVVSQQGQDLNQVIAADINGDGRLDLVLASFGTNAAIVLLNQGGRSFAPPVSYTAGNNPISVVAADFNGDGKLDLVRAGGKRPDVRWRAPCRCKSSGMASPSCD